MGLGRSAAVVVGSFPLGESDLLVTFYSREHGKIRGVAKAARRMRSRFTGTLELFTLGELVFFDTGRSELLRIDHFDVVRPLGGLREDLEILGQAAWIVECITRLTPEHDRHVALYGLLVRALRTLETSTCPARVALCFGVRCLEIVGHRPRLDTCGGCGRSYPFTRASLGQGSVLCEPCARQEADVTPVSPGAVAALERLRATAWTEALAAPLGRLEDELSGILESYISRLIGQPTRTGRFVRQMRRLAPESGGRS